MRANLCKYLLFLLPLTMIAGCLGRPMPAMQFTPHPVGSGQYAAKVQNAVLIQDASMTMEGYGMQTAKGLLTSMNQSLPADLKVNLGLRSFGHSDRQSIQLTEKAFGMSAYSAAGLQTGIDAVKVAGGNSPLDAALLAAGVDLQGAAGKSAIIVLSDGLQMDSAPAAAGQVKQQYGDNLCIYTINIGRSMEGDALLAKVAKAGGCGFAVNASALSSAAGMGDFVDKVFLAAAPKAAKAAPPPAPMDSDGDGVYDDRDKCPGTPKGEFVDADGCTLKLTLHVNFEFDKADIKPEFRADLDQAANFIQKNHQVPYILIAGHTDNVGTDAYNQALSLKRAENVRQALIDNYGINPDRLGAKGYGKTQPVATNDTDAGRYQNRRVEVVCCVLKPE